MDMTDKQSQIVEVYVNLAKKLNRHPSRSELIKNGISRDRIRDHFGDMDSLREVAATTSPATFKDFIGPDNFDDVAHARLKALAKKSKRFVVTTAVSGAPVHKTFLESIKTYCKLNKATLLVIPANYALYEIDPALAKDQDINVVFRPLRLNSNITVDPIKICPKQVDPVLGLEIIGKREGTLIIGSPKQRRVPIANSNEKLARIIQATGAITHPQYIPSDGIQKRRDRLAHEHHVMGAILIDIVDDVFYHFRPIQMSKNGSFNDLFHNYSKAGKKYVGCEAIVQGDYHVGETDPKVDAAVDEMCKIGKPKYRVLHDFFSGESINHWTLQNRVERARLANQNKISLKEEMKRCAEALTKKIELNTSGKLVIVKSNHDDFVDRYVAAGNFDDLNRQAATQLQLLAIEGKDPLKGQVANSE